MALAQLGAAIALALSALPPPPDKVVLETRMYGTITVDHRAHLANRVPCRRCHGDGPVRKLDDLTPQVAHERCRGCHVEIARGPTACRGCHVVAPSASPLEAAGEGAPTPRGGGAPAAGAGPPAGSTPSIASASGAPPAPRGAAASGAVPSPQGTSPSAGASGGESAAPAAAPPAGATQAAPATVAMVVPSSAPPSGGSVRTGELSPPAVGPPATLDADEVEPGGMLRTVQIGMAGISGSRGGMLSGPALRLVMSEGRAVFVYSLEWPGSFVGEARTVVLVGGGLRLPLSRLVRVSAVALGGIDALDRTSTLVPALALRAGVEWSPSAAFVDSFGVTVTGMTDVGRHSTPLAEPVGGATLSAALTFGFRLSPAPR